MAWANVVRCLNEYIQDNGAPNCLRAHPLTADWIKFVAGDWIVFEDGKTSIKTDSAVLELISDAAIEIGHFSFGKQL